MMHTTKYRNGYIHSTYTGNKQEHRAQMGNIQIGEFKTLRAAQTAIRNTTLVKNVKNPRKRTIGRKAKRKAVKRPHVPAVTKHKAKRTKYNFKSGNHEKITLAIYVIEKRTPAGWWHIATFRDAENAKEYARALHSKTPHVAVRVIKK